jgi:hypothetical protein
MQNAGIYHIAVCSQPNSLTAVFPGALPLDPAGGMPPDPHFLALRARLAFSWLSDEQKLPLLDTAQFTYYMSFKTIAMMTSRWRHATY